MILIAGLGNPGAQYKNNRHNIGFMAADALADAYGFGPERSRFGGLAREGAILGAKGAQKALILKPQTYMNESGRSLKEAAGFFKIDPKHIIVFHDEMDLAEGRLRMKGGGGHAGHNGLRSIMAHIGPNFRRARLGVGHPGDKALVLNWVLSDFYKADQTWLEPLLKAVCDAAPFLIDGDDERYQAEVMRLAPAPKLNPRQTAREG